MLSELYARDYCAIECNVWKRLSDGITHKVWEIPISWFDSYVIFGALTGNLYVLFGIDDGVVADPTAESADMTGNELEVNPESCDVIAAGTVARIYVPRQLRRGTSPDSEAISLTHFAVVSDDADGGWFAYPTTQPGHLILCPEPI